MASVRYVCPRCGEKLLRYGPSAGDAQICRKCHALMAPITGGKPVPVRTAANFEMGGLSSWEDRRARKLMEGNPVSQLRPSPLRPWLVVALLLGSLAWPALAAAAPAAQEALEPTTHELWLAVLAVLTVIVTWGGQQLPPHFTDLHKRIICAVVAGVFAAVGVFYQGLLDTNDWGRTWLVIFMAATSIYVVLVKPVANLVARNT